MSDSSEVYYIVLRGSRRQPIFKDDEDRRHFARVVADTAAACHVTVHAYCWLQDEARLAAQMPDIPVSEFARRVTEQHAQRLEEERSLTGADFDQRYRGVRVDGPTALLDLVRHIHLAPLKAGLTEDLLRYPWSSHRVYMGLDVAPWLNIEDTLLHFADTEGGDARVGYSEFMAQGATKIDRAAVPSAPIPAPKSAHRP